MIQFEISLSVLIVLAIILAIGLGIIRYNQIKNQTRLYVTLFVMCRNIEDLEQVSICFNKLKENKGKLPKEKFEFLRGYIEGIEHLLTVQENNKLFKQL